MESEAKCKRACDRCRFKRVRCRRQDDCCQRCLKDNKTCLFADEQKKRGPKPKSTIKKRRSRAKGIASPSSDTTLPNLEITHKELLEHDSHTKTFFGSSELVNMWIQTFISNIDPDMQYISPPLLNHMAAAIPSQESPEISLVFLLRCMVACTILASTSDPINDLFLVHYDMAVKALRLSASSDYPEAVASGIHLLSLIDRVIEQPSY